MRKLEHKKRFFFPFLWNENAYVPFSLSQNHTHVDFISFPSIDIVSHDK